MLPTCKLHVQAVELLGRQTRPTRELGGKQQEALVASFVQNRGAFRHGEGSALVGPDGMVSIPCV